MPKLLLLVIMLVISTLACADAQWIKYRDVANPILLEARRSDTPTLLIEAISRFGADVATGNEYAEQYQAEAQYDLGKRFLKGSGGVEKDYTKALKLFEASAERKYVFAISKLAMMHALGQGTDVDYSRALDVLEKGGENSTSTWWGLFEPTAKCGGTTTLYRQPLRCSHRSLMHRALEDAGLEATQLGREYWAIVYETSKQMPGSDRLEMFYTRERRLGLARYVFPSSLDSEQVVRVKNLMVTKYGDPKTTEGNPKLGPALFGWILDDGVELQVSRDWPDTTTFISYYMPDHYDQMKRQMEEQETSSSEDVSRDAF